MVQIARPDADEGTDGGWVNESEGSSLYASIDDDGSADGETTFIYVTDTGSPDTCIVELAPISAPVSGNVYIKYTALSEDNSGDPPGIEIRLLEGGATRGAAHTNNSVASSWGTEVTSSAIDVSSVSDWGNLELKITMLTADGGGMDYLKVTQAYLETPEAAGGSSAKIPVTLFINGMST